MENAQLNTDTEEFKKFGISHFTGYSGAYAISDGYYRIWLKRELSAPRFHRRHPLYGDTVTYADNTKESVEY